MLSIKTGWEVHNDIQLISKKKGAQMFTQCYSNLTGKKRQKRCSDLGVSYCFQSAQHGKSMAEYILGGGAV